jgi:TetR/AcrR family transcriptional regulator, transcriptional repressor for nem operon
MRYLKEHKAQTRNRIVERASYGLCRKGANGLSIAGLMKLADLTHGGFYSHFESRDALVVEAFAWAMDRTVSRWQELMEGAPVEKRFDLIVEEYLSSHHCDNRARGCALPALGADIARSNQKTRRIFAEKLEEMIDVVARQLPQKSPKEAREVATSAIATMVGSIVLARAAGSKKLSDDILGAGRQAVRTQAAIRATSNEKIGPAIKNEERS